MGPATRGAWIPSSVHPCSSIGFYLRQALCWVVALPGVPHVLSSLCILGIPKLGIPHVLHWDYEDGRATFASVRDIQDWIPNEHARGPYHPNLCLLCPVHAACARSSGACPGRVHSCSNSNGFPVRTSANIISISFPITATSACFFFSLFGLVDSISPL